MAAEKQPARDPAEWHGIDPILDEDVILRLLRSPVVNHNLELLQAGAAQALIDMYDRDGSREAFAMHASNCLALYASIGRMYLLNSMKVMFKEGVLVEQSFDTAQDDLQQLIRAQAMSVGEAMEKLKQCASSEDPIH